MGLKILVALQNFGEQSERPMQLLQKSGHNVVMNTLKHRLNKAEIIQLARDCEGIIAGVEPYDDEVLSKLSLLKCISRCGAGIDNIDLDSAKKRGISILNTPDIVIQPVAEMTVAMVFDLLRMLTANTNRVKSGKWTKQAGWLLYGRKVGILGLGRIGKKVAEIFTALGCTVYGFDLYPDKAWAENNNIKLLPMTEIFNLVDVLCLHVSVDKKNPFLLGKEEISRLKKGAIVINTSRGQNVDEGALYQALISGKLAGAGLDVFNQEPYKGPLCELDNVVLTPHVSTLTLESRAQMETQAVDNILEYFNKK